MAKAKTKIDFTDPKDLEVLVLGSLGFSTAYIEAKTKRSPGQIGYRLKIAAVKRADYRNGVGPVAKAVVGAVHGDVAARMQKVAASAAVTGRTNK